MNNSFITGKNRRICLANFNLYEVEAYHPDRILDEHDIFCVLEGSWSVGQDGVDYYLEKGDFIILHAGCHHYGIEKCLPRTKTMFLHMECLPEDRLESNIHVLGEKENFLELPVVIRYKNLTSTLVIFQDIIFTFWSDFSNKNIKLTALIDLLLFELAVINNKTAILNDKLVSDAIAHIRLSGEKIYSLTELSDKLDVCSRVLTERFKKATGKTIHSYQMDLKLEMAYISIKSDKQRPFKELAVNFGFYDEFHFSKLFKKKYGFAPSKLK